MVYTDPRFEARRKSIIAGTSNQQDLTVSQPVRSTFVDQGFEARRSAILQNRETNKLPPLTIPEPTKEDTSFKLNFGELAKNGLTKVTEFFTGEKKDLLSPIPQNKTGLSNDKWLNYMSQASSDSKEIDDLSSKTKIEIINYFKNNIDENSKKRKIVDQITLENFDENKKFLERLVAQPLEYKVVGETEVGKGIFKHKQKDRAGNSFEATELFDRLKTLEYAKQDLNEFLGVESSNKGIVRKLIENIKNYDTEIHPYSASRYQEKTAIEKRKAIEKYQNGEELTDREFSYIKAFRAKAFNALVKSGLGDQAADVMTGSMGMGMQMLMDAQMTGDIKSSAAPALARIPAGKAKTIIEKILGNSVQLAAQSNFNIPAMDARTAEYMLPTVDYEEWLSNDKKTNILDHLKIGDDEKSAKKKAYLTNLVEYMTEGVGDYIDDAMPFIKKAFVGKWLKNKGASTPGQAVSLLKKMHINGIVGEVIEEETGEPINAMIEERQYQSIFTPEGRERVLVETLGIGALGGMARVPDFVTSKIRNNRKNVDNTISIPVVKEVDDNGSDMLGFGYIQEKDRATSGLHLTDSGVYADLTKDQLDFLRDEVEQLDFKKEDKPHLSPIEKLESSELKKVSLEELRSLSPSIDKALSNFESQKQSYDYSSTQLNLPSDVAAKFTEFANSIPDSELVKTEADGGRETEPHITVLYGLTTTNEAEVRKIVESAGPITVELGDVSIFENKDYDVVKANVISEQLQALNQKIDEALDTEGKTFKEYKPHVTIAYVQKGEGKKYVGDSRFNGQKITLNELTFSSKDGRKVQIPLIGKKAENGVSGKTVQANELEEKLNKDFILRRKPSVVHKISDLRKSVLSENKLKNKIKEVEDNFIKLNGDGSITLYRGSDYNIGDIVDPFAWWTTNKDIAKKYGDKVSEIKAELNDLKSFGKNLSSGFGLTYQNLTSLVKDSDGIYRAVDRLKKNVEKKSVGKKTKSRLKEFPGVLSGLANKGADKIHNFELRKPPKPGTNEFKLHKKITELIRKYAQTIGEGYTPRNALGVYFPKTKNIRINNMNNVSVAAHEIAHFLDYANNITDTLLNTKDSKIKKQIKEVYQKYYPNARPQHQARLQTLEGFSTLLQKYTEQPTTISQEFPDLVNAFLKPGGKYYHKVVGDILTDLNQMIGEYQGLAALDKVGARVTSEGTNIDKGSFLNFWQKLRTQVADEVYPVEVLAKKGKVSFTKEDPSLWVRAYNSVSGIINNNISTDRGYWSFTDLQSGWQKKYDYNWRSLIESTQRRGITDSFANYLVARREYFLYQELDAAEAELNKVKELKEAFDKVKPEEMDQFDRDMRGILSEDYGIDLTEQQYDKAKKSIQKLYDMFNKAYLEQKEILDKDGFNREDIEAAYNENKATFRDEETMFDALTREDLDLLYNEEVQLINKKTYNQLKNKEGYASFKRQFYDEIVGDLDAPGAIRVGGTRVSSLIGRKGSERTIINPLYSALANHSEIVRKSMKQVVYNQIGKLGVSASMPNIMQQVPLQTSKNQQTGAITFPQEKDNNIIMARKDYKRTPILMDGEVKTIIDSLLTHKNVDTFTQLYTGMSRTFTAGTTGLFPQFALTNFMVDQITATANSYNKYKALYSPIAIMRKALSKNGKTVEAKYYEEYLVMGGERQTFSGWQVLEPKDLFKRIADEKTKMESAIDKLNKGVDILSIPAAKSEIFSRATEYINARKAGKSQIVALEEAGRVTAPFHHIGSWGAKGGKRGFGQTFIRGLPFFNASIQVLDQTARVASTKEGQKRMAMVTLVITAAYLSSILAMMDASDEQKEQYKDLEGEDLANFIYYPNPTGSGLIRVKMANTFSVPGTVINMAIANRVFGAKNDAKDVLEASTAWLPAQFNPTDPTKMILGWIPQVFKPATHVIFNVKEYPSVKPLVNLGLQRKPAGLQYNEGTSAFAKKLGEWFNLSPIKVDYLLTGYFGRASGFLTGKPGIYNPASSVMRDYYFTTGKRVSDFYKISDKNDKKYTAYQNYEKGYENLSDAEVKEIYRVKYISSIVDDLMGEYYDLDVEANQEKAAQLRAEILMNIEYLETDADPKGLSKYMFDAKKRRLKNKTKK